MNVLSEIYTDAADILAGEGAWTQGVAARDRQGRQATPIADQDAASFDVLAALELAIFRRYGARDDRLFWAALEGLFDTDQAALAFNDAPGRTQAQVVSLLRIAARISAEPAPAPPSLWKRLCGLIPTWGAGAAAHRDAAR